MIIWESEVTERIWLSAYPFEWMTLLSLIRRSLRYDSIQKTVLLKPAQVFHSSLQHDWLRVQQFKVLGMQRLAGGEDTNSGRFTFALSPSATCFLPWCPSSNSQLFKQTKWNIVNVDAFHIRGYEHAIVKRHPVPGPRADMQVDKYLVEVTLSTNLK